MMRGSTMPREISLEEKRIYVALRVYKRWRGAGGINDEVRCDLSSSPTSPSDRSLRRGGGENPPHHFGSLPLTGSGAVSSSRANAPRIYFHFTDKYLYAGSNDVKFIGQTLWWMR
jgi:hypothetical protein